MTVLEETLAALTSQRLPRFVCPFQVQIGDLVRFGDEPLPVVILDSEIVDRDFDLVARVLVWETEIRKSDGRPVFEGRGVHEPGEKILLLRRAARSVTR
jgi:hypothetical protein